MKINWLNHHIGLGNLQTWSTRNYCGRSFEVSHMELWHLEFRIIMIMMRILLMLLLMMMIVIIIIIIIATRLALTLSRWHFIHHPPINCNCKSYSPSTFKTITSISLWSSTLGTRRQLIVIVQCSVSKQILIINILWLSTLGTRRPPEEQTDTSTSQTDSTLVASR